MVNLEIDLPNTAENLSKMTIEAGVTHETTARGGRYVIKAGIELADLNLNKRMVRTIGAASMFIKHPSDYHDPLNTLKKALGKAMLELGLSKFRRAILWGLILKNYNFNSFVDEYYVLVNDNEIHNFWGLIYA